MTSGGKCRPIPLQRLVEVEAVLSEVLRVTVFRILKIFLLAEITQNVNHLHFARETEEKDDLYGQINT